MVLIPACRQAGRIAGPRYAEGSGEARDGFQDDKMEGEDDRKNPKFASLKIADAQEIDYNVHMQFQVPQFIETEDKVIGPFSIRQFIYIGVGAGICAMFYFMFATWLWMIFSIVIMGAAGAFAFIKIDGRPFINIVLSAFSFYWKPQTYLWRSEQQQANKVVHPTLGASLQNIAAGLALHKGWENIQTGTKISDMQMTERYQIFRKQTGERRAAKRVDYR